MGQGEESRQFTAIAAGKNGSGSGPLFYCAVTAVDSEPAGPESTEVDVVAQCLVFI